MKKGLYSQTIVGLNLVGFAKKKDGSYIRAKKGKGVFVTFALNPNKEEEGRGVETSFWDMLVSEKVYKKLKEKGIDLQSGKGENKLFLRVNFTINKDEENKSLFVLNDAEKIVAKNKSAKKDQPEKEERNPFDFLDEETSSSDGDFFFDASDEDLPF